MKYDPWSGSQQQFERTDPTGRWSIISEKDEDITPWWLAMIGGMAFGAMIAIGLYLVI